MESLKADWLAVELREIDSDIQRWSEGLRDSFLSLVSSRDHGERTDERAAGDQEDISTAGD
jgi:hypothetical protein